jgi:hypothetical protein
MIDIKYTFVCNCQDNDLYSLVMSAWYIDADGNRITTNSDVKTDLTLEESFTEAQNFVNNNQTV